MVYVNALSIDNETELTLKKVAHNEEKRQMKVRATVKLICRGCKMVKRNGIARVICSKEPRHKSRAGSNKRK